MTKTLTLAVIGHVNHGKTALVRALTGIETDRLREEIERGLSITLGFAWRDYPDGSVDFIDAPGHEDFIRAMVIGTTGARAALLVVSATEGFGRQTREHLRIAALLGVRAGVVAITKADLLPEGGEAAIRQAVAAELRDTFMAGEPVVLCSSVSGAGLDELHRQLRRLVVRSPPPEALPGAFLPLDRVFSVTGAGAVVTGSLLGDQLLPGQDAILQPSGRRVGLRQLQIHGHGAEVAGPGGRVAVGLRGVSAGDIHVGEVLCGPEAYAASQRVDVEVRLTPDASRPLKHMEELRVMWGARSDIAAVRLMGATVIGPGEKGVAQLRFSAPVVAFAGQRAILRRPSPAETIGGLVVLDPVSSTRRVRAAERLALLEAVASGDLDSIAAGLAQREAGVLSVAELSRLSRRSASDLSVRLAKDFEDLGDGRLATRIAVAEAKQAYLDSLTEAHRRAPTRASASTGAVRDGVARRAAAELVGHAERSLAAVGAIRLESSRVALSGRDPFSVLSPEALAQLAQIENALRDGGIAPPDLSLLTSSDSQDLVRLLIEAGRAVSLRNHALRQTLVFHRDALLTALRDLRSAFPHPTSFTTGEARAALGTTRKFIVPILENFDALEATSRDGDIRKVTDIEIPFGLLEPPIYGPS